MADYIPVDEVAESDATYIATRPGHSVVYTLPPELAGYTVRRVVIARRARKITAPQSLLRVTVGR